MTSVKEGGFYGWSYSNYGQHVDERVKEKRPDLVAQTIVPDYALGSQTASLGLVFYYGKPCGLPKDFLTGFLSDDGEAYGRPVGVAVDKAGALLVADEVGNIVWRVAPKAASQSTQACETGTMVKPIAIVIESITRCMATFPCGD